MPAYLFKSILSIFIVLSALAAMFTMFELFGRDERRFSAEGLRKLHKINGMFFMAFYLFISYFCLKFLAGTHAELSSRAVFHSVFALSVIMLLMLKIVINRFYRQFYDQLKSIGLVLALLTFGMAGTSGGYYLLVTGFGTDLTIDKVIRKAEKTEEMKPAEMEPVPKRAPRFAVKTDGESINRGRALYESNCTTCHDPRSYGTVVGPGHKGVLNTPMLPVSKRPATPENIKKQLKSPYRQMPAFDYLTEAEVNNIIAYLNTL
jgi:mono/diheme cytochrome c family protein